MNILIRKNIYRFILIFIAIQAFDKNIVAQTINYLSIPDKEKLIKADEHYFLLEYQQAVNLYLEIVSEAEKDTALLCRIANSYRMLNEHTKAEEWYRMAIVDNETTITAKYKLFFAQELAMNGKYDESLYWFQEYYKSEVNDQRALASIESIENLSALYYDTTFYVSYPVEINSAYAEFCPAFYNNEIIFLSDRDNPKTGFLSWFVSESGSDGAPIVAVKLDNQLKTQYNAGPLAFFDNNSKVIFCQNYSSEKLNKKQINEIPLQLFSADVDNEGHWINVQLLQFVKPEYSYTQPSVSSDNKSLYFSSNCPGGYGGADLYKCEFENGVWTDPINLGSTINTSGDEMFPFVFCDTVLYFSSNGHGGQGGLDIVKINLNKQDKVDLFGVPVNSSNDDFGLIINRDGLGGYYASNRPDGKGNDDIYAFKVIRITFTIKIIDDNTALPVSNAGIFTGDEQKIGSTDENGSCTLIIPVSQLFELRIEKENYETKFFTLDPIEIARGQKDVISITISEEDKIELTDQDGQIIDINENVTYKVQIFASRKPATKRELKRKYKGNLKIDSFYEDNWYKYSIGEYLSYTDAKKELFNCDVFDAFIIAYIDNKKVHISIAKSATSETSVESPISRADSTVSE